MFGNIPDNYDMWEQRDLAHSRWLERLPKCFYCEEPIQQETAVCLDGTFYCDECLDNNRVEVDMD